MLDDVAQLASGVGFDCALRGDGTVWCWGNNGSGQQGDLNQYVTAVQVKNLSGAMLIGVGQDQACARAADGVYCWGNNFAGEVGIGTLGQAVTTPTKITTTPGLDDVVQMAGGQGTTCALTSAGEVFCWGFATQVGNGGTGSTPCGTSMCAASPTKANVSGVVEIAFGDEFALARLADGSLMAWGGNTFGQIGNPQAGAVQVMPVALPNFP
jgi:alpha-tubulin suppressor-like RCC1 family protein